MRAAGARSPLPASQPAAKASDPSSILRPQGSSETTQRSGCSGVKHDLSHPQPRRLPQRPGPSSESRTRTALRRWTNSTGRISSTRPSSPRRREAGTSKPRGRVIGRVGTRHDQFGQHGAPRLCRGVHDHVSARPSCATIRSTPRSCSSAARSIRRKSIPGQRPTRRSGMRRSTGSRPTTARRSIRSIVRPSMTGWTTSSPMCVRTSWSPRNRHERRSHRDRSTNGRWEHSRVEVTSCRRCIGLS
jgi:hypothetical protein